ncbi:MAG TPA: SpoIID/LytB domain-containing protein [Candidatus Gemmiger faecigallinarum]|nr:SpoIID/LytB domain-containing protein [Candidatus Gemmiger faecigallinarum]
MVSTQLRILRVFGLTSAEVTAILRQAQADGCTGLRLLERDGEFAVCVQASAPTQAMADEHCDKWAQKLAARFGDAVYGTGETSLAQATLDALLKRRRMLVAVDETTGRMLGALLRPLEHSEAAFDFGTQTYADPVNARKIITPPSLLNKFPGDVVQAAAGRAQLAMAVGQADCAAVYMPATVGQAPFVLVCDHRGAAACALGPDLTDAAIANNILDLVRRRTLGLKFTPGTIQFRPGHERPLLLVSQAGQSKPGDTARFSLRRRKKRSSFEPMLDFDTAQIPKVAADAAAAAVAAVDRPGGRQEKSARPTPDNAASVAASAWAAAEQGWDADPAAPAAAGTAPASPAGKITFETAGAPDAASPRAAAGRGDTAFDFETGGAEAAAKYRSVRTGGGRRLNTAPAANRQQPPHSILDDDLPDLTSGLDPAAVRAAQAADDANEPSSLEDFQSAVRYLYDTPEPDGRETDAAAAMDEGQSRSLARIEKAEQRQRRTMLMVLAAFLLLVAVGAAALFFYFSTSLGAKPSPRGYGTAQFDQSAQDYLANAADKREDVAGYLAFPGMEGELVYLSGATTESAEEARPQVEGASYLGSDYPANTALAMHGSGLDGLSELETLRENAGFTLYLADGTYRYKVMAVYYQDGAETGAGAFDISGRELSDYGDYLDFVLGARARSLYDTAITVGDNASFLTLVSDAGTDGVRLCVTGRLIGENEDAQLAPAAITVQDDALLPAARYAASGQEMPDVTQLLARQMEWYATASAALPASADGGADGETGDGSGIDTDALNQSLEDLEAETEQLTSDVDKLLAGLTDRAGQAGASESDLNQGAEGAPPQQSISVDEIAAGRATPTPDATPEPTQAPSGDGGEETAPQPTPEPTAPSDGGGSSAEGETINVTMNGSQQTLDLVTCLAMIAQNELGSNAPAEAYKAQCVAAHCWIISQGGYPSVAGATPGEAALAAAREVAHVLVTYNGNVCFTPYFASASTGTASSADVWGGDLPWLQAVESPYDQSFATNWNTNGASSGTARFARQTVQQRIQEVLGIDLSGVDPNSWFKIVSANQYGWVSQIQIGPDGGPNVTRSGSWFRETLLAGQSVDGRSLRSQCFTVTYDSSNDCFIFDVYGYGHGCGLSQWGTIGYATNGWSYQDILLHYFPGTTLTTY